MTDTNFTIQEIKQLCVSFIAIVLINAVFFHAGIFSSELQQEPPNFTNSGNDLIVAGDIPENPGSPNSGLICPNTCNRYIESQDISEHHFVSALPKSSTGPSDAYEVNFWNTTSNIEHGEAFLNESNTNASFSGDDYDIYVELEDYNDGVVRWQILSQPKSTTAWYERIPGVGGLISTGEAVGALLGWIGSIILWFLTIIIEIFISILLFLSDFVTFIVDFLSYYINGWIDISQALNNIHFVLPLLAITPQIPLYFIWLNAIIKILKVLPLT